MRKAKMYLCDFPVIKKIYLLIWEDNYQETDDK